MTLYSMVRNWRDLRELPMFFYLPRLLALYLFSTVFLFSPWYCVAGVFGVIALSWHCSATIFNDNNNNNKINKSKQTMVQDSSLGDLWSKKALLVNF